MPQTSAGYASQLESILESAADAIITIDSSGTVETVNPAAEILFGYDRSEFVGRNIRFLMPEPYHPEYDDYIRKYRTTGNKKIIGIGRRVVGLRGDGTTFPMLLSVSEFFIGDSIHFTGIIHDLTEQSNAEQALLQSQKMEAIGQLTGGIAHDFNNLLTVIVGTLEMLRSRTSDPAEAELVSEALSAAEVGARLTGRLLAFVRRAELAPELVDLNDFVSGISDMLRRTLGETIELDTRLSPGLWSTRVDPSQVVSAIVNLAVNARDAMPGGGRLLIETQNVSVGADGMVEPGLPPGDYARLAVSDNGSGMPPAVQERAFEPFFTTKERGKGTGLGLAMIYGFAKQSSGYAAISSREGTGTTVRLYLPRHHPEAGAESITARQAGPVTGKGEWILVVEDDSRVRRLTAARLNQLGYRVAEATNGKEALDLLHATPDVRLVFTDLVMPNMSGHDLAALVRDAFPNVGVLLTSGFSEEAADGRAVQGDRLPLLQKPYRIAELAEAVHAALAPRN
jgi:PAS domain S-box-containing protein